MLNKKIAIVGVGHIGQALVRGLLLGKRVRGENLILANPHLDKLQEFKKEYGVRLTTDNIEAISSSEIIILSVRPKIMPQVVREIKTHLTGNKIIISVAACVPINLLEKYFYPKILRIVRIMPNIPITYGKGVVGWVPNRKVNKIDKELVVELLQPLGLLVACRDDEQLEKLSMIAGCGTGYVTYFMKNLTTVARTYGFSDSDANRIVLSTFIGTTHHLFTTKINFEDMIQAIATKGGITEEVLNSLNSFGFNKILNKSINLGYDKIEEIKRKLIYDF